MEELHSDIEGCEKHQVSTDKQVDGLQELPYKLYVQ